MQTMRRSVYIIKPEGMSRRETIRQMIAETGLVVVSYVIARLTLEDLELLYPHIHLHHREMWDETLRHLLGQECEVGLVEGDDAVHRLLLICGRHTAPPQCSSKTIRGMFGDSLARHLGGTEGKTLWYYPNVIHRPRDEEEARKDLQIAKALGIIR